MTKRPGATTDNGFIFKKINENSDIKGEKILWAVFEIIPFIQFDKHLDGALGTL